MRAALRSDARLSVAAFVILGLPVGALGVGWPRMRAELHAPLAGLGFILTIATVAAFSNVATGRYIHWLGQRRLVVLGSLIGSAGVFGLGFASTWPAALVASAVWGLGTGPLDAGLNAYVARSGRVRLMGWIHAAWGFGAALGPLAALLAIHVGSWRWSYAGMGVAFLGLGGAALASSWESLPGTAATPTVIDRGRLTAGMVARAMALFAVNFGLEASAGQWAYTNLTLSRGLPSTPAGVVVSAYWAALTAGRVLLGLFGGLARPERLLMAGMSLVVMGALGLWLAPSVVAAACLPLIGLGMSIVVPLLYLASRAVGTETARLVGYQSGGGTAGGATIPAGVGLLMQSAGAGSLPPAVLLLAMVQMGLHLASRRRDTGERRTPADAASRAPR